MPISATGRKTAAARADHRRHPPVTVHSTQRGFTLIEMMVVIVIIAILTGFAMLRLNQLSPDSVANCSTQLRSWFGDLSSRADALDQTIYIEPAKGGWQAVVLVRQKDKWAAKPVAYLKLSAACALDRPRAANNVTMAGIPSVLSNAWIAVTPDGRWRTRDGGEKVALTDRSGATQTIDLSTLGAPRQENGGA